MSVERIFYCDGPDCERHVRTAASRPTAAFLVVSDCTGAALHFCTWDCVLKYGARIEPTEVIPWHPTDGAAEG